MFSLEALPKSAASHLASEAVPPAAVPLSLVAATASDAPATHEGWHSDDTMQRCRYSEREADTREWQPLRKRGRHGGDRQILRKRAETGERQGISCSKIRRSDTRRASHYLQGMLLGQCEVRDVGLPLQSNVVSWSEQEFDTKDFMQHRRHLWHGMSSTDDPIWSGEQFLSWWIPQFDSVHSICSCIHPIYQFCGATFQDHPF